ncbi:MAG TPA: PKD domain-containing protein [Methanomicrobiales archaeon]|nr:PKD domain-containing protein [Methanomicrobiales archaeon]
MGFFTLPASASQMLYYSFDFVTSNSVFVLDDSGNGHQGEIHGAPIVIQGIKGNAFHYNGINDFISFDRITENDFTTCFWVNTTDIGMNRENSHWYGATGIVDNENIGSGHDWGISLGGNQIIFGADDSLTHPNIVSQSQVNTGHWVSIIGTRNALSGEIQLYVNGKLEGTAVGGKGSLNAVPKIFLANMHADNFDYKPFLNGAIDELKIYDSVLDEKERSDFCYDAGNLKADFLASPTEGVAPLQVSFSDTSSGSPTSWSWDFGDGNTLQEHNPGHEYTQEGSYSVTLSITNETSSDTTKKTHYIIVHGSVPEFPNAMIPVIIISGFICVFLAVRTRRQFR